MPVFGRERNNTTPQPVLRRNTVLGLEIAHLEVGTGPPIVFLHSGLGAGSAWLRVLPYLADVGRCIALHPVGFGESQRLHLAAWDDYSLQRQESYFDYFMEMYVDHIDVTLVLSGLASVIGFSWAQNHEDRVRGICHMESVFRPLVWPDLERDPRATLRLARGDGGERFVLDTDNYLKEALGHHLGGEPDDTTRDEIIRLFGETRESRFATLATLRDLPISGLPSLSHEKVRTYGAWLAESEIPKLLILGQPGYFLTDRLKGSAARLLNQRIVAVRGKHVLALDSPSGVGRFIRAWMQTDLSVTNA